MATQETIKQLNAGGVLRDVEDVTARGLISSLQAALDALTSGDTTTAIKTFNEIIAFLDNIEDTSTLQGIIAGLNTSIAAKYTKPSTGIPASDLAQAVQTILNSVANKANTADVYTKSQTYDKDEVDGKISDLDEFIYLSELEGYDETLQPSDMRAFLQGALDEAGRLGKNLKFPHGKTYTISIPPISSGDWEKKQYEKQGGEGLVIPSNIVVDFNYCTINVSPNDYWGYSIVYFNQNCVNATIKNGIFVGDRQGHTMSGVTGRTTDEWIIGITVKGKYISIENCDISEVRGDGIVTEGYNELNTTKAIKGTDFISSNESPRFNAVSKKLTIDDYLMQSWMSASNQQRLSFVIPYSEHKDANDTTGCVYHVRYYDENEALLFEEDLLRGEYCNIPSSAVYMDISVYCDNSTVFLASTASKFWVCALLPTEEIRVTDCHIHDCGRNGISLSAGRNHYYTNLKIEKISGTNNYVGIDLEGYALDTLYGVYISGCSIDTGYRASGGDIAIGGGHGIFIDNCVCHEIYGVPFDVHIDNSVVDLVHLRLSTSNTGVTSSGNKELLGRSTVKNTTSDLLHLCSGMVENCSLKRLMNAYDDAYVIADSTPIYKNCKIDIIYFTQAYRSFISARYQNCEIHSTIQSKTFVENVSLNAPAVFDGCYMEVKGINGFLELRNTTLVHICDNATSALRFKKILNSHIILKGSTVYDAFCVNPLDKYALFEGNTVEEEANSTIRYGLIGFVSDNQHTTNLIVRNNNFISHTPSTTGGIFYKANVKGSNLDGSTVLFSDNVIDCVDAVKDFSEGVATAYNVRRFNNIYISASKQSNENITDLDT